MDKFQLLASLEAEHGLPNGLLKSVMTTESNGNQNAVSPKGARGYFQFMPATAKQYGVNPTDFNSSATGAARMYADLLKQHNGDLDKALASYNWGSGNVSKNGLEKAPTETKNYITKVKSGMNMDQKPWEDFAKPQSEGMPWEDFAPSKVTQPKARTFEDDLKAELEANPIGAKLAAFGTAASDLYQGGKQLFGYGDKEAIRNNKIIADANPGSALVGNIAMYSAAGIGAPVFNTARGAAAIGTAAGALSPVEGDNVALKKIMNAGIGGATGFGATKLAEGVAGKLANNAANKALMKSQNATRDATQLASQQAGYVLPPSYAGGGITSRLAEGLSGKYKTNQAAQILNQKTTNNLAREYLGMPKNQAFSDDAIQALKNTHNQAYRDVAALPPITNPFNGVAGGVQPTQSGKEVLNQLKDARFNSKLNWQHFNRTGDPDAYAKAAQLDSMAENLENTLEAIAKNSNKPELVNSLRASRKELAKVHTIDKVMNDATGDVDASVLGRMLTNGAPLSDQAKKIARFSQAYTDVSRVPKSGDANPMTALDWMATGLGAGFSPYALALPVGRMTSRAAILSPMAQKSMANKNYSQGLTPRLLEGLLSSGYAPMALTGGALPSLLE